MKRYTSYILFMAEQIENRERIYLKSICKASEKLGDKAISISVDVGDFEKYAKEHGTEKNGKRYLALKLFKKKETSKYGETHHLEIDMFKPTKKEE